RTSRSAAAAPATIDSVITSVPARAFGLSWSRMPLLSGSRHHAVYRMSRADFGRLLPERPAGELQKRLVLMADEFDRFRAVCHNLLEDSDGKRPGIRLRIVDGELDVQQSVVHSTESLDQLHRLGIRATPVIEPSCAEVRIRQPDS